MELNLSTHAAFDAARNVAPTAPPKPTGATENDAELRETFNAFVGQTLFGQMLESMRKTVGKPAYFHGGQAEEIFQKQLDQILGEKLTEASGSKLSEPMFELFALGRR